MRLIDADTLKAEFTGNFHEQWHYTGVRAVIDVAPTIDPVKHGEWIFLNNRICKAWECSECGEITTDSVMGEPRARFCPYCGAKMDGDE